MIKLAFVFRTAPYGSSAGREGLDALLAATAFCDENEIAVFFIDDGVFNLPAEQHAELILQRDFVNAVKLLDLYEIKNRYVCSQSLQRFGLLERNLAIFCEKTDRTFLLEKVAQAEKCLTF